eukprot:250808_1
MTAHCIDNNENNINFMLRTLQIKTIILTMIFIAVFSHRIYIRFIISRSMNFKSCYFGILVIIFMCLLFSMIDYYFNNGIYMHTIGLLFGLLSAKYHLCSCSSHHHLDGQHLTQTYDANATKGPCCCPAGCGIDCKAGCCEWNNKGCPGGCNGGNPCCVFCGCCNGGPWCCTQPDYPGNICFSCCGVCTCYLCDPGGCCDLCCCSIDWFTWCCCC